LGITVYGGFSNCSGLWLLGVGSWFSEFVRDSWEVVRLEMWKQRGGQGQEMKPMLNLLRLRVAAENELSDGA